MALLVTTHYVQVWHVFATAFIAGTLQAFQQPARQALISDIVGERYIMNAVALNSAVLNVSRSIGPMVAGFLISWVGTGGSYFGQSLVFVIATVWTVQMRVPKGSFSERGSRKGNMWQGMTEGLSYIRGNRVILMLLVMALVPLLLGQPYSSLLPVFAKDVLSIGSEDLGLLFTAAGIGALIGALYIATVGSFKQPGWLLLGGAGLFGVSLIGLSLASWLPLSLAVLAIVGFSNTSYNAIANTLIQTTTPPELRGRVLGIYFLERGLVPLGTLLAGALATWFGAPMAVGIMGLGCALLAVWAGVRVPALRQIK